MLSLLLLVALPGMTDWLPGQTTSSLLDTPSTASSFSSLPPIAAHWPLQAGSEDISGHGRHLLVRGEVVWHSDGPGGRQAAGFGADGAIGWLELPSTSVPQLAAEPLTITAWVQSNPAVRAIPGDIISGFEPQLRRGFHLGIKTAGGVTFSQSSHRHLQFGIDDGQCGPWIDCGRPGEALLVFAMATHRGQLYAATCEPGEGQVGRVYRYDGDQRWSDVGPLDGANSVTALAVYDEQLYAGTGRYRVAGSSLPESPNQTLGGQVFRLGDDDRWIDCGRLPETEAVGGMVVFDGQLYASSLYQPAGFYRFVPPQGWQPCPLPEGEPRIEAMAVHAGYLYGTSYDAGNVYRFDGQSWFDCGQLADNTQTYSLVTYQNQLHVGTWPSGRVYRLETSGQWSDTGRLGEELEVMGMAVYNGSLYAGTLPLAEVYRWDPPQRWHRLAQLDAGTLPLAEVYRWDPPQRWHRLAQLDATPNVKYRRAWTMAEHAGRLFCSTLPSGRVYAMQAGLVATWEEGFPNGWHHVAAVRNADRLDLYLDGRPVAASQLSATAPMILDSNRPWRIGTGPNGQFRGGLADVRIYQGALSAAQIELLAADSDAR
jgi:hypothetical protein